MAKTKQKEERMDQFFSVFNSHVNNASKRADKEYKKQFGKESFKEHIKPLHEEGIMSIFHNDPTPETQAWVSLVTAYVNEDA